MRIENKWRFFSFPFLVFNWELFPYSFLNFHSFQVFYSLNLYQMSSFFEFLSSERFFFYNGSFFYNQKRWEFRIRLFDKKIYDWKAVLTLWRRIIVWFLALLVLKTVFIDFICIQILIFWYHINIINSECKIGCLSWIKVFELGVFSLLSFYTRMNLFLYLYTILHCQIII